MVASPTQRACFWIVLLTALGWALPLKGQQVTPPAEDLGFEVGADGELADWDMLRSYYELLAEESDRLVYEELGETTLGEPFVMLTVTSPANHARLDEYHRIQKKLADPREIDSEDELEALLEEARSVVLITNHIHSTEVASGQMPPRLLHRLASSVDPKIQHILEEVILLYIPSLNPDGTQLVAEWWEEWRGTEYEGAPLPELYHHYAGHDNNRDWYAFTQVETQLAVENAHNRWHPHIVHDIHQMGGAGARFFVPPYLDPLEPNIDPRLVQGFNQLGAYVAAEMTREGLTGVVTNAIFDIYTPARAYMHYHGGVRILSETASANGAMPDTVAFKDLSPGTRGGYEPQQQSWNFPHPWPGGVWRIGDAIDYMDAGAMALLGHAANNRDYWVRSFHEVQRAATNGWDEWPAAWIVPAEQDNELGLESVLRILTMGAVEVRQAEESWVAGNPEVEIPEGSYVIEMQQPFAAFAQTLLERQDYPEIREYPGGPPVRPYDATTHNLPLLMDVEAFSLEEMPPADLSEPIGAQEVDFGRVPRFDGEAPRIGLYRSYRAAMPEGWTRWLFDRLDIDYDALRNDDIRRGGLADRYDVIVLQDQPPSHIMRGWSEERMPEPYAGGIGEEGVEALRAFVESGGRLVTIGASTDVAIEAFELPVESAVEDLSAEDFYIPGTLLQLDLDINHPLAEGTARELAGFYWRTSRAFDVLDRSVEVVARYGSGNPKLSGWILGHEFISDKPALLEVPYGEGSVVLFGFQPNFRGQTVATWPLFLNALEME